MPRTHCAELLHWYGYTPRGESATGEATIDILYVMLNHVHCQVMSLVMSSASGEVHQAHRASGDQGGEEAAQVPLPLPGEPL